MMPVAAIMRVTPTTLRTLPPASIAAFPGRFPWSPISTKDLTAALDIDPGAWTTWRNRRLTPPPLPAGWFRRATGGPLVYRADTIRAWLAGRRGETYDALTDWQACLRTDFEEEASTPEQVRGHARMWASVAGPVVGEVRFTPAGFTAYLDNLLKAG